MCDYMDVEKLIDVADVVTDGWLAQPGHNDCLGRTSSSDPLQPRGRCLQARGGPSKADEFAAFDHTGSRSSAWAMATRRTRRASSTPSSPSTSELAMEGSSDTPLLPPHTPPQAQQRQTPQICSLLIPPAPHTPSLPPPTPSASQGADRRLVDEPLRRLRRLHRRLRARAVGDAQALRADRGPLGRRRHPAALGRARDHAAHAAHRAARDGPRLLCAAAAARPPLPQCHLTHRSLL